VTPDQCWNVNDGGESSLSEAPVNVGDNYNRPKVAKFLVW